MYRQELSVAADGGRITFLLTDAQLNELQQWNSNRHCHADYELHLILRGSCTVYVESDEYVLQPGNALLIAPGQYHHPLQTSGELQRLCLCFSVSPGELSQALARRAGPCALLPMDLRNTVAGILQELSSPAPFRNTLLHGYLEQLTVFLLRSLEVAPHSAATPPEVDWRTGVIDEYFENHITDGSEAELAQLLHLSTRQLSRVLLQNYGMSFRQKRTGARMDYAGFLLRTTARSISKICSNVGYQSEAVFFRNFKAHFGLSPQQYRKHKANP